MTETITTATARVVEQLTREAVAPREIEPDRYPTCPMCDGTGTE